MRILTLLRGLLQCSEEEEKKHTSRYIDEWTKKIFVLEKKKIEKCM